MTREEIMNMPAGRKMDALVAEKVMGWQGYNPDYLQSYSTDIAAAWEVAEKVGLIVGKSGNDWVASDAWDDYTDLIVHAPTAPLAICRAALLAMISP